MSVKLAFTKMHGAGNDFVVLDFTGKEFFLSGKQLQAIADRHLGIGCDQILVVEKPRRAGIDFRYRIFNADGGEVEQCGNGARCFVKFVHRRGLTAKNEIRVETLGGTIVPRLEKDGEVSVDMGAPRIESLSEAIDLGKDRIEAAILSMGNPHAVQLVPDVEKAPVTIQGPLLERHPRFPNRTNVSFVRVVNGHTLDVRFFERGAGEAMSSGTGSTGAGAAAIARGLVMSPVQVLTPAGPLALRWEDEAIFLAGPAEL
ncbi:MAG TPA: diaminopimelate epimerase, partial [Burkholderiales bacterium]|nr:diaminopimelate epimerase [Burkholderiales bacterium]